MLVDYVPILVMFLVALFIAVFVIVLSGVLGPSRPSKRKLMPYESGMDPVGDARQRFDVKFYLIAIMFLIFDVELLFLFPWGVVAYAEGGLPAVFRGPVFWGVLIFIVLLLVAYVYDWRKGVFRWR